MSPLSEQHNLCTVRQAAQEPDKHEMLNDQGHAPIIVSHDLQASLCCGSVNQLWLNLHGCECLSWVVLLQRESPCRNIFYIYYYILIKKFLHIFYTSVCLSIFILTHCTYKDKRGKMFRFCSYEKSLHLQIRYTCSGERKCWTPRPRMHYSTDK